MHGLRSGRVLSAEAFVPVVMEIHHPPGVIVFSSLEAHWTPLLLGFYGGFLTCCCSVAQLCPTLWDPMNYSTPGFPVLHNLQEFAQIHFHWAGDAIYVILCIFSFAFSLSQHQGLFLTQTWAIINFTSSPSPLIGMGVMRWGRGCVCKFLNIACLFWWPALIRTRNAPGAYHFRNYKVLQSSVSETRAETNIYISYYLHLPSFLSPDYVAEDETEKSTLFTIRKTLTPLWAFSLDDLIPYNWPSKNEESI